MLNLLIAIPLVAAFAILLGLCARRTALVATLLNLGLTLGLLAQFNRASSEYQFASQFMLSDGLKISWYLGADGLSLLMLLLTALVGAAAVWVAPAPGKIARFPRLYYACLLFIIAGATGAFASLDLFFFYAFHELALIPTFILIGVWGSGDRVTAAWKITIYLAIGSFVLLVGLLALYFSLPADFRTFNIVELQARAITDGIPQNKWIYLTLLAGFGTLVSLFPFHSWAPQAYASAPAPAAMLHAGVLKKFGLYGLLRVALPLMPTAAQECTNLLLLLLVGNILYVGFATIAQKRLDMMLGYSSVMHMGYIFLGIAAFNPPGLTGASLLIFAHGISIAILFALTGSLRERVGSLEFAKLGGLARHWPFIGFAFALAAFASIGLPCFGNFAGELSIFFGGFGYVDKDLTLSPFLIAMIIAAWGLVISAVYMLRAVRATFQGTPNPRWAGLADMAPRLRPAVVALLAVLLFAGVRPQAFVNLVSTSIKALPTISVK